ncbi:MAG TPA: GNAT family N-acetyltransferase [Clostridia bacterium]|nr:GNAT family N-acetyltransferase [Clostridia bacterium]
MIYFSDDTLLIRTIEETDPEILCEEEIAQRWQATEEKYRTRVADSASGKAVSLVAEYKGNVAGYINVYKNPPWGSFANMGYCEIVDFGVLEKYRCRGIGSKLMDIAEKIASEICRYRLPRRRFAQRIRQRAKNVLQARVHAGRQRRLVQK